MCEKIEFIIPCDQSHQTLATHLCPACALPCYRLYPTTDQMIALRRLDMIAQWQYRATNTDCVCAIPLTCPYVDEASRSHDKIHISPCDHGFHQICANKLRDHLGTWTCPMCQYTECNVPRQYGAIPSDAIQADVNRADVNQADVNQADVNQADVNQADVDQSDLIDLSD
jgi:hypothetical protein